MVLFGVLTGACGGQRAMQLEVGQRIHSSGEVSVSVGPNGTQQVTVRVTGIPRPQALGPGLTSYVVWLTAARSGTERVGALRYDGDAMEGVLAFPVRADSFWIQVSAERSARVRRPAGVLVARRLVP